jgi:hypothetical protein
MRKQIEILNTEQTADNRPLTDAELNGVSGAIIPHFGWYGGTGFGQTQLSAVPAASFSTYPVLTRTLAGQMYGSFF